MCFSDAMSGALFERRGFVTFAVFVSHPHFFVYKLC